MINEIYKQHIAIYIERLKNVETESAHPIMFVTDRKGLLINVEDVDIEHLYPHKVYKLENNHVFRKRYEHIKQGELNDKYYIFIVNDPDLIYKIQDFIKRSLGQKVYNIDLKDFLNQIEYGLNWHERINDYNAYDIEKVFEKILMYRKLIPKKVINREETDLIVLSAIYDMDATKLSDAADCYIYYQNVLEVYGTSPPIDTDINILNLMTQVFRYNRAEPIGKVIEQGLFELFDKVTWISLVLENFNQLTKDNLQTVLGNEYEKLNDLKLSDLINLAERVERKDKKVYLQKRDRAEKIIRESNLKLYKDAEDYVVFIRENQDSATSIVTGIRNVLKDLNLEGAKRLYKYSFENLKDVLCIVTDIRYEIDSIKDIKRFLSSLIRWIDNVYELEQNATSLIKSISNYSQWEQLFSDKLYDLEYELSEIRYSLDKESFIETSRYEALENRLNNLLNLFRKPFAKFVESHYSSWIEYGSEQPILNQSISDYIPVDTEKTLFIIFDGMRYDAWRKVVEPYFKTILNKREVSYRFSMSLLPSITSLSREAIYKGIRSRYSRDINYKTKSESENRQQDVKNSFLMADRINILIFSMFDREGHSSTQGLSVFYKRQKEIFEAGMKELIDSLPKDTHIVIASDHGFSKVNEYIKIDDAEQVKTRYVVSKNAVSESIQIGDYKIVYSDKGYYHGGGERDLYSHGGASFEEMLLPFIHINPEISTVQQVNSLSDNSEFKLMFEGMELSLSIRLNKKETEILKSLSKGIPLTTKDIEILLINRLGEAGMVDGMMRRLGVKLSRSGEVKLDINSAGEIIVYTLIR